MAKIVFIMDDSEAMLRTEALRIAKEWGFDTSSINEVTKWNATLANQVSLFGDVKITYLDLTDKNHLKSFAELVASEVKAKTAMFAGNWFGEGLIITSTAAQGTKSIETLVKASGGEIVKKEKPEQIKERLLSQLNLSKQVRDTISDYIGLDYEMLLPMINEFKKLTKEEQLKVTLDEAIITLPTKPGSIPPWEFVNPVFDGKPGPAIEQLRRTLSGSHVLVPMTFMRKKITLLYRTKMVMLAGVKDNASIAAATGDNPRAVWYNIKVANQLTLPLLEYLVDITNEVEGNLKGASRIEPNMLFENYVVNVALSIKNKTPHK